MADIFCQWQTDHTTDFKNSWKLISKNKDGNRFQFMGYWRKLKDACTNGTIQDLLQCLAEESISAERSGIGDFVLHFSIVMNYHRNYHLVDDRKEIWTLLFEELDPHDLVEDIKSIGIVGEKDIDDLMDCMPREQRIGFLLGRLLELMGEDKMFKWLLNHCKRYGYKHILEEKKELFTAKVILSTRMKEATGVSDNSNVPGSEYITSVDIQDPRSFFDTIGEDVDVKEIFMKLGPASDTAIEGVDDANVDQESDMELAHDLDTTRDKAVQTDPYFHKEDKSVGTSFDGDNGVTNQSQVENPSSVVEDLIRLSNDYHDFIQEEGRIIEDLLPGNKDQHIKEMSQNMELVKEAREFMGKEEEVVQMVQELKELCE